jgi:uncharacterized integral membrane protein
VATRRAEVAFWGRVALLVVVGVYAVLFIAFNVHRTRIDFVFASTRVSLIFLVLVSLGVGFVLGVVATQLRRHGQRGG